ncbi:MAG TPA: hypothetical protein VGJ81_21265 [Thermoanaerobaculia bacterium]|jgi:hypothetical protein
MIKRSRRRTRKSSRSISRLSSPSRLAPLVLAATTFMFLVLGAVWPFVAPGEPFPLTFEAVYHLVVASTPVVGAIESIASLLTIVVWVGIVMIRGASGEYRSGSTTKIRRRKRRDPTDATTRGAPRVNLIGEEAQGGATLDASPKQPRRQQRVIGPRSAPISE